ncbi:TIGR01620 family protein [Amylibacter kogurei]|uniref:TIGR01620 family protein n=1 Tax=Paramylibacter kogurei TaxID=1889778 RepID=A0A2G5KB30_9RHOB|nr:TIGR01620 family protein [Amylibacter kogurei]PIB25844.1 TIGR01620 family protein [Amylibacter kogurei]
MSKKQPIVIELDDAPKKSKRATPKTKAVTRDAPMSPADAPAIIDAPISGDAMQAVTQIATSRPSRLLRFFGWAAFTLLGLVISIAFWDFTSNLMARNIWLGRIALGLIAAMILACVLVVLRELGAMARLRKIDDLREKSEQIYAQGDLAAAKKHSEKIVTLLKGRDEIRWALVEYREHSDDQFDTASQMHFAENTLLLPLDQLAQKEIESAARQVATATAMIPLALADVVIALTANVRMIRRIAQVYGGRTGTFGAWRLMKAVATHLVATGAVAIGDDMIGSIAGGGVLSKLSRRFGEGVVNGALTARVGIAAMEVCRPMPFVALKRPTVTALMKNALTGFFGATR